MTQYYTGFSEYSAGVKPADWTEKIGSGFLTAETGGADKLLKFNTGASLWVATWDDIDADANRANSEGLTKVRVGAITASSTPTAGIQIRLSDGSNYYSFGIHGTTTLRFRKVVGGTGTNVVSATVSTISINTWYWIRARVNGTSCKARIWADGASEPSTWDIDTTDSSLSSAASVGCGSGANASSDAEYELFGVGTNGDTAPASAGSAAEIAGTQTGAGAQSGAIVTAIQPAGVQIGLGNTSGGISSAINIAATVEGIGTQEGDILTRIEIGGEQLAAALQTLALQSGSTVAGIVGGEGAQAANIILIAQVGGQQLADSLIEGGIATAINVAGQQYGAGAQAGELGGGPALIGGSQDGAGAQSLILSTSVTLTGQQIAEAILLGSLSTEVRIGAVQNGQGLIFGEVATVIAVEGTVGGTGAQSGTIVVGTVVVLARNPRFLTRSGLRHFRAAGRGSDFRVRA